MEPIPGLRNQKETGENAEKDSAVVFFIIVGHEAAPHPGG